MRSGATAAVDPSRSVGASTERTACLPRQPRGGAGRRPSPAPIAPGKTPRADLRVGWKLPGPREVSRPRSKDRPPHRCAVDAVEPLAPVDALRRGPGGLAHGSIDGGGTSVSCACPPAQNYSMTSLRGRQSKSSRGANPSNSREKSTPGRMANRRLDRIRGRRSARIAAVSNWLGSDRSLEPGRSRLGGAWRDASFCATAPRWPATTAR